jgi:hypothetical protein
VVAGKSIGIHYPPFEEKYGQWLHSSSDEVFVSSFVDVGIVLVEMKESLGEKRLSCSAERPASQI